MISIIMISKENLISKSVCNIEDNETSIRTKIPFYFKICIGILYDFSKENLMSKSVCNIKDNETSKDIFCKIDR